MNEGHAALLIAFAEGRVDGPTVQDAVIRDDALHALLKDEGGEAPAWVERYGGTALLILTHPANDARGVLQMRECVGTWLERHGIAYVPDQAGPARHKLLLDSQPRWLDVPLGYFEAMLESAPTGLDRQGLRKWARQELRRRFVSRSRPPRWIQSPTWPILEGEPLVFLGQVPTGNTLHDDGFVYVFLDPRTRETRTVVQTY